MSADTGSTNADIEVELSWEEALNKHVEMMESNDRSTATIRSHKSRLGLFIDWLTPHPATKPEHDDYEEQEGPLIHTTAELARHHIQDYRFKRSQEVNKTTLKTQMDTLRVFARNLEQYGALPPGMHSLVESPDLTDGEGQRSDHLPEERGDSIREHLRRYEWASEGHILYELLLSSGMRLGSAHSIDVKDIDFNENIVRLRHRPDKGTTLKNKQDGERSVTLHPKITDAIQDFLNHPERPEDVEDEYGRVPLFCTGDGNGRRGKQYLRELTYSLTRPCQTEDTGCPHDRDIDECPAASSKNKSYKCPSSKAPHAARSGAITRMLRSDVPPWAVSRRVNCSEDILEKHYNEMSDDEKADQLRAYFDDEYE